MLYDELDGISVIDEGMLMRSSDLLLWARANSGQGSVIFTNREVCRAERRQHSSQSQKTGQIIAKYNFGDSYI